MDNLIDETFFWGELKIAGLSIPDGTNAQSSASKNKVAELSKWITKYQKEYITRMFGDEIEINEDIKSLLVDYTTLSCPIANYVYFRYMTTNATQTTGAGEKKLTVQNTENAYSRDKLLQSWNAMVDMNQIIHQKMYLAADLGDINYLNDILINIPIKKYTFVLSANRKQIIQLHGGIFSKKSEYDIKKL